MELFMETTQRTSRGSVVALWRYPVKSMLGEELNASLVTERGLVGDRGYALIDQETEKVVSAKNPRRWSGLFDFRATFLEDPADPQSLPSAWIRLPNGARLNSAQEDIDQRLSEALSRPVKLASSAPANPVLEGYWPDYDWLDAPDRVFDVSLPKGTFFDSAVIHLITTATLDFLRSAAPASRFEVRRFRPNLVIDVGEGSDGFVEDQWAGRTLSLGSEVRLRVMGPCARCVMTTLSQADLPKDPGVLRTAVQKNRGNVGVLAAVVRSGRIARGDTVDLDESPMA
jgi:uncharacterized protein